jgi:hypothetical protein
VRDHQKFSSQDDLANHTLSKKKEEKMSESEIGEFPATRTHSTEMEYYIRYQRLRRVAVAATGARKSDHVAFSNWIIERRPTVMASYWRKLKAVALHGLNLEGDRSAREAEFILQKEGSSGAAKVTEHKTKLKRLTDEDLNRVLDALAERHGSELAPIVAMWLKAGRLVGLRPCEWRDAKLLTADGVGGPYLRVPNAKRTNGRSHGEHRTLDLQNISKEDIDLIEVFKHHTAIAGPAGFRRLQSGCMELLSRVNGELWPRRKQRVTLYSARHQFSANTKRQLGRRQTAALMGHKTTLTAGKHYARQNVGYDLLTAEGEPALPVPMPEEVARIIDAGSPFLRDTPSLRGFGISGSGGNTVVELEGED